MFESFRNNSKINLKNQMFLIVLEKLESLTVRLSYVFQKLAIVFKFVKKTHIFINLF